MPTRDEALALMQEHTPSESLRKHMLAVEACVRHYARLKGADEEQWGQAALLHDFDYELHPDDHPLFGMALLAELGYDQSIIDAIAAHYPAKTGRHPQTPLERTLFACDELAGLITAVAYVRPSKSVLDVEVKSVLKKLKEVSFAAGVNREDVRLGAELLDLPIEEHVSNMLDAMKATATEIGLAGIAT